VADPAHRSSVVRRDVLRALLGGAAGVALSPLFLREAVARASIGGRPWQVTKPRAKNVIYLFMAGGTSQVDMFDPKPVLRERDGQPCPDRLFEVEKLAFIRDRPHLLGSPYAFERCGESGREISELLPYLKTVVDDIAVVKSMQTGHFNHTQAQLLLLTGSTRYGRPSAGAWVSYGLGSESRDLPAFVVMNSGGEYLSAGVSAWGPGFLPSIHQGVEFRGGGEPVLFLSSPSADRAAERDLIDTVNDLNRLHFQEEKDPETETRIAQYEMAHRMQAAVPAAVDMSDEPEHVLSMYGAEPGVPSFARNCLLARRLVERGVRLVQLFDSGWDHHSAIFAQLPMKCREVDRPAAALVRDLKQRGLLDDTLVIFASEFGRTPMGQTEDEDGKAAAVGRDHDLEAFTVWLAGGGIKPGIEYGQTDEFGYSVVENPVHIHDLNATILHLLGVDHEKLVYRYQGRDFRLTDVHGNVVHDLIS
jgi:uncharacterized protein (DUF1501 family)